MFFAFFLELYSSSSYNKGRGIFAILRYVVFLAYILAIFKFYIDTQDVVYYIFTVWGNPGPDQKMSYKPKSYICMYSNSTVQHNHIGHIWLYMSIMLYSTHTYPCFSPFQGKVLVPCGTTDEPSPYSLNRKKNIIFFIVACMATITLVCNLSYFRFLGKRSAQDIIS